MPDEKTTRAAIALLAELAADRTDSEAAKRALVDGRGRAHLLRALHHADAGRNANALADVDAAMGFDGGIPFVRLVGGMVAHALGAPEAAAAHLEAACQDPRARPHVWRIQSGNGPDEPVATARRILLKSMRVTAHDLEAARCASDRAPRPARVLDPTELAHFLEHGYVHLGPCFSPEVATRWVAAAHERIRTDPARWVRGYEKAVARDPSLNLGGYDPRDRATHTWARIDLDGPTTVSIEEHAPRAWDAILDLMGGRDRVATTQWHDYLVVNFWGDRDLDGPQLHWPSWHVDDPGAAMQLSGMHRGLIAVCLYTDVEPGGGNTFIAPGSAAHVARLLAASPGGVDFVDRSPSVEIMKRGLEMVEITGRAGDVILLHALTVHSASPNKSNRIRFMSNPMIHATEPLEPFGHHPSPVEEYIRRALDPAAGADSSVQ